MTRHRQVLARIIDELIAFDPECSILLGGSLSRGEEREDSDIDVGVWLSRNPDPSRYTDLIKKANRARWHVCAEREGIKVDTGWRLLEELTDEIPKSQEMVYYPFVLWTIVRDPSGKLTRWVEAIRRWLDRNLWVVEVWGTQYTDLCRHKKDPSLPLKYNEKEFTAYMEQLMARRRQCNDQEFYAHIRRLMAQREREVPNKAPKATR